jgi:uncharacterized repeat protein (TIGR03833 family)
MERSMPLGRRPGSGKSSRANRLDKSDRLIYSSRGKSITELRTDEDWGIIIRDYGQSLLEGYRQQRIGAMNGQQRSDIRPGKRVEIILKKDQRTGKRTAGVVRDILTSAAFHSRGIKVRLEDGQIGRVQEVLPDMSNKES